jgi:diaminopimelate decarboxylase
MSIWKSITELENRKGHLYFDGCNVNDLVQRYGSPLYVYSKNRIKKNYFRLLNAYKHNYPHFEVFYAIKANNNPAVVKTLALCGAGGDASCLAEIQLARNAGIPLNRILYSAVYSSHNDLSRAMQHNVRLNVEDITQLTRLRAIGMPDSLCIRVNPGVGGTGAEGVIFAGPDAKFGVIERDIEKAYALAKEFGVKRFGIHMMTGSNILKADYFQFIVEKLLDIAGPIAKKLNIRFDFIDIGGSLGVPYRPNEEELDIELVAASVVTTLRKKLEQYDLGEPLLIHEPGRYLVADAGILLAKVTSIKEGYKKFIGLDAGMHTLLRPALYQAYHHILYANNLDAPEDEHVNVVGQICENTDTFAANRLLSSKIAVDDILAFLNTGAYGFGMSTQYNSQPRSAEVLVDNGKSEIIRERETFEDLVRGTKIPEFVT